MRSIAADSLLAVILVGVSGPLWYLVTLVMARLYGDQAMGTYFIAWNLVLILTGVCRLGLDIGLLRFSAVLKTRGQVGAVRRLLWPAVGLMIAVSAIAGVGLYFSREWLASHFNAPSLPMVILFVAPALPVFVVSFGFRETIRALGGIKASIFQKNILTNLAFIIFLLFLGYWGRDFFSKVGTLGLAALLNCLVNLVFLMIVFRTLTQRETSPPGETSFRELLWYSWPLFLNSLLPAFNAIDRLILGFFTSPSEVAYYEVAAKVETIITLPLVAVNSVIPPLIVKFYECGNMANLELIAQTTARWAYFLGLPLTLLLILLAPEILGYVGANFIKARFALIVLSLAQLVNVASGSVGFILYMTGHQWTVAIGRFVIMGIAAILMAVLAKAYGLDGVACASAFGLIVLNVFLGLSVWRYLNIKAFAWGTGWANLSALLGVLLFFVVKPLVGPFVGAAFFLLAYLALLAKTIKKEIELASPMISRQP